MGKPAARLTDMHMCPMVTPGLPPIPHVGGPIIGPGAPTVMIGGMPAAVMGDSCICVGPPSTIIMGSTGVMIGGKPAARMGDPTAHGGVISMGCPTVLIGEIMAGGAASPVSAFVMAPNVAVSAMNGMSPSAINSFGQVTAFQVAAIVGDMYAVIPKTYIEIVKKLNMFPEEETKKTEIDFQLLDQNGEPVKNENYKVTLPGGGVMTGKTDNEGKVHIAGIDPGSCKVSFPDIHEDDWS